MQWPTRINLKDPNSNKFCNDNFFTPFLIVLFTFFSSCKKDKAEPDAESKIDINGTWIATGYTCMANVPNEIISIVESNGEMIATKYLGDDCAPAGVVTWKGNCNIEKRLYDIIGTTVNPASETAPGSLSVKLTEKVSVLPLKVIRL